MQNSQCLLYGSSDRLVVGHIARSGAELGIGFDHFVHCIEKVLLSRNLQAETTPTAERCTACIECLWIPNQQGILNKDTYNFTWVTMPPEVHTLYTRQTLKCHISLHCCDRTGYSWMDNSSCDCSTVLQMHAGHHLGTGYSHIVPPLCLHHRVAGSRWPANLTTYFRASQWSFTTLPT